ncbi:MAG TPA: hypothetical protein VHW04_06660, partial [Solirubrobacteraceae bacterium]|nr:hypothetical protein [Solirubrobacteraceae bacterium]
MRAEALIVDDHPLCELRDRRLGVGGAVKQAREKALSAISFVPRRLARSLLAPAGIRGSLVRSL